MDVPLLWLTAIGTIGTLIGAWLVYKALKADHDWNRRQYAMDMLKDWNANTAGHAKAIEDVFPHLRDVDRTGGQVTELTKQQSKHIYTCNPEDASLWNVRFHLVELLNYLEVIAIAYVEGVADEGMVHRCFRGPMMKWHDILTNFIQVVETCEGYQPWEILQQVVGEWKAGQIRRRPPTA